MSTFPRHLRYLLAILFASVGPYGLAEFQQTKAMQR